MRLDSTQARTASVTALLSVALGAPAAAQHVQPFEVYPIPCQAGPRQLAFDSRLEALSDLLMEASEELHGPLEVSWIEAPSLEPACTYIASQTSDDRNGARSVPTGAVPNSDSSPAVEPDKSGTDPTKFLRTLSLRNEFQRLPNESSLNLASLTYIEPFAEGRMNLRLRTPFVVTDALGDQESGLGDLSLRYNWLPIVDAEKGVLLSAELIGDTATEDVLGRGKWIVGPAVTYAMFLSPTMIFAPAYQHNFSVGGDGDRVDVNESVIDLYMVFTALDKKSWFIVDPTLVVDWENDTRTPVTLEAEFGRNFGSLWGGALNLYARPGVGIGADRPYDWSLEIGLTIVGL